MRRPLVPPGLGTTLHPNPIPEPGPIPVPHPNPGPSPSPNPNPGQVRLQPGFTACLKPHQLGGVRFLFDNVAISCASLRAGKEGMGALLAHSMGLGKTLTTIALIDALLSSTALRNAARTGGVAGFRCVLVVAPATVLQNWCDEADKWSLP